LAHVSAATARSLTEAERAFLENPYVGVVTDLRPDGSPHSTVVWVDVDDEGVSFNTAWPRAKPRYLRANPRVALLVVDPGDEYRWISISGVATLVEDGANAQIDRLAKKYKGLDSYPWHKPEETRVSVRISPTWIEARGID
jgi:PPOX class probable F420-dependent enzyme